MWIQRSAARCESTFTWQQASGLDGESAGIIKGGDDRAVTFLDPDSDFVMLATTRID